MKPKRIERVVLGIGYPQPYIDFNNNIVGYGLDRRSKDPSPEEAKDVKLNGEMKIRGKRIRLIAELTYPPNPETK